MYAALVKRLRNVSDDDPNMLAKEMKAVLSSSLSLREVRAGGCLVPFSTRADIFFGTRWQFVRVFVAHPVTSRRFLYLVMSWGLLLVTIMCLLLARCMVSHFCINIAPPPVLMMLTSTIVCLNRHLSATVKLWYVRGELD